MEVSAGETEGERSPGSLITGGWRLIDRILEVMTCVVKLQCVQLLILCFWLASGVTLMWNCEAGCFLSSVGIWSVAAVVLVVIRTLNGELYEVRWKRLRGPFHWVVLSARILGYRRFKVSDFDRVRAAQIMASGLMEPQEEQSIERVNCPHRVSVSGRLLRGAKRYVLRLADGSEQADQICKDDIAACCIEIRDNTRFEVADNVAGKQLNDAFVAECRGFMKDLQDGAELLIIPELSKERWVEVFKKSVMPELRRVGKVEIYDAVTKQEKALSLVGVKQQRDIGGKYSN